jgi:hypothetical protein
LDLILDWSDAMRHAYGKIRKMGKKIFHPFPLREPYFLPPFLAPAFSPDLSFGFGASFGLGSGFFAIVGLTSEKGRYGGLADIL